MLRLFSKISLILLFSMFLSIGIDILYRRAYNLQYQWPQNIWIKPEIDKKYEIVKVGNSHAGDGLTFSRFNLRSLSLIGNAQSFEYDLAMLKMYSRQIEKDAIIIINISPISFSQKKPGKTETFQYVYYDGRLSPFLIPNLKLGDYMQSQIVPFTRAISLWRDKYAQEVKEKAMESFAKAWDKPTAKLEEPKPEPIPALISKDESSKKAAVVTFKKSKFQNAQQELASVPVKSQDRLADSVDFMLRKWYHSGGFGKEDFALNTKDLENLIRFSYQKGWRPVLISIPISQALLDGLGPDYKEEYVYQPLRTTNIQGIEFFDFSINKQFIENGFLFTNSDHLSSKGAEILSRMLLEKLIERGYLPKQASGYK